MITFKPPKIAALNSAQLLALLLLLGLFFRLVNLDQKIFWVDEVLTALRVAGYSKTEVTQQLADGLPHLPAELLAYQQLSPSRGWAEAIRAFRQSPEHAPLYFLLLRGWTEIFGSSVLALRSFSVACSLLLLGAVYGLSRSLFNAQAGQMALGLTAISPLFVAYAQEARPYSFWLLLLTLNGLCLLWAVRQNQPGQWLLYALSLTLSLYSSLLTGLVILGQIFYVGLQQRSRWRGFGLALLAAIAAVLPWLWLVAQQWQKVQSNTTWMRLPLDGLSKLIVWFYSVAILYFDVPVRLEPWWLAAAELGCAAVVVGLIIRAFMASGSAFSFIGGLAFSVPLVLIGLDLVSHGRYSTAPRYLLPFHLGAQLAMASWLSSPKRRPFILGFLITVCLLSNLLHFNSSPLYLKSRSLSNPGIAQVINQAVQPLLLSESQNTIDLLSLSHLLNPQTQIKILPTEQLSAALKAAPDCQAFIFNPSSSLQSAASLTQRYQPQLLHPGEFALTLWQLQC